MRLPKSPEEKRATKAARQARWRARKAQQEAVNAHIDYSAGVGPKPTVPMPPISGGDLTTAYKNRMHALIEGMSDEELLDKDVQAAISNALKAQNALDAREKVKAKQGNAQLAFAIIQMLTGAPAPVAAIDDGMTFEGEAVEVEPDGEAE